MQLIRGVTLFLLSFSFAAFPNRSHAHISKDKIMGSIMGAAMGDALGRVTEFIGSTEAIHKKYGSSGVTSFESFKESDWIIDPKTNQKVAAYTDDTVMALIVFKTGAKQLTEKEGCANDFQANLAREFANLFGPHKYVLDPFYDIRAHGITNMQASQKIAGLLANISDNATTQEILSQLYRDFEPKNTTERHQYWWLEQTLNHYLTKKDPQAKNEGGCGSVMRAWPLGLINFDQHSSYIGAQQSLLTHRHPMALAACAAITSGVYHAAKGESVEAIVAKIFKAARLFAPAEQIYKTNALNPRDIIAVRPSFISQDKLLTCDMISYAAVKAWDGKSPQKILGTHNKRQANYRSTDGFLLGWAADEAVAAAVYIFVRHPDDIKAALTEAVNTPGDSDSIATLVGALVGARIGFNAMKDAYQWDKLENFEGITKKVDKAYDCISQRK